MESWRRDEVIVERTLTFYCTLLHKFQSRGEKFFPHFPSKSAGVGVLAAGVVAGVENLRPGGQPMDVIGT